MVVARSPATSPRRMPRRWSASPGSARATGVARDLRQLPVVDGAAVGRPDVRHARAGDQVAGRRPVGAPARPAAALRRCVHGGEGPRRPGDGGIDDVDDVGDPVRHELRAPLGWLARGWARDGLREVRDGRRLLRRPPQMAGRCLPRRRRVRARRLPRARAGQALLLGAAHVAPLRDRVLRQPDRRQQQLRAVAATWSRTERGRAAIVAKTLADYEAPPLDEAVDEALRDFIDRTKASMPDMWY